MFRKPYIVLAVIAAAALVVIGAYLRFLLGDAKKYYYTQIDNSKIEETVSDGGIVSFSGSLPYTYRLDAYDEKGDVKTVSFGTSKKLKNGAFIRLTYVPLRGVIEWNEVDEIPIRNHQ